VLRSRPIVLFAAIFFPLFVLYASTASYSGGQVNDAIAAAVPAWYVANEHTLTLPVDETPVNAWFVEANGRRVSNRFPGVIAFAVPFYLPTRGVADHPTIPEASVAAAFAAALTVALLALLLRRVADTGLAVGGALVFGLATNTWSVSASSLLSHGPAQLWLVVAMLFAARDAWGGTVPAYAAAILTRPHLVLVPGVALLWHGVRDRAWRAAAWLAAACATGLGLLALYNHHVYGRWSFNGGYDVSVSTGLTRHPWGVFGNIAGMLLSPGRGLLGTSPFVLLLLLGLRPAWRAAPSWARAAALGGVAYLLLQLEVNRFSGGSGFYTYRLPIEALTAAAPLLLLAYREWVAAARWRRVTFAVLLAYSVAAEVLGAVWYGGKEPTDPSAWTYLTQYHALLKGGVVGAAVSVVAGGAFVLLLRSRVCRAAPALSP
jgi:alpha-1,2-mannosyltransferase